MATQLFLRQREIRRVSRQLEQSQSPRLLMLLIVALAGACGFLATVAMLHAGVDRLWVRYVAAVALSYGVFLSLLWYWLHGRQDDGVDLLDPSWQPRSRSDSGSSCDARFEGGGGHFGGAGASGSFDDLPAASTSGESSSPTDIDVGMGEVAEASEAWPLAMAIAAIVLMFALLGAIFASTWVVWNAPMFMGELLVDAALARGLYRRMRGSDDGHWLKTALRRTFRAFAGLLVLAAVAGFAMQAVVPDVQSLGAFLHHTSRAR